MVDVGNDSVYLDSDSDIDDAVVDSNLSTNKSEGQRQNEAERTSENAFNEVSVDDEEDEMRRLLQDVDCVSLALRVTYPDMQIDPNVIFEQLEVYKLHKNRVEKVVQLLRYLHASYVYQQSQKEQVRLNDAGAVAVEAGTTISSDADGNNLSKPVVGDLEDHVIATSNKAVQPDENVYDGLLNDVQRILEIFPDVNGEEVYAYLEARRDEDDRVQNVIEELIHRNPSNFGMPVPNNIGGTDAKISNGTRFDDDSSVPRKRIKIDNLASAVVDLAEDSTSLAGPAPNQIEKSMKEFLQPSAGQLITGTAPEETLKSSGRPSGEPIDAAIPTSSRDSDGQQLSDQFIVLKDTFPDADPDHLFALASEFGNDEIRLQQRVTDMLENKLYPKLKDRQERERKETLKYKFRTNIFTPEEVLQWFDDPLALFYDTTKPVSKNYEQHSASQLRNDFPRMTLNEIQSAIVKHRHHYTPALRALQKLQAEICTTQRYRRRRLRPPVSLPTEPDELFYKELAFSKVEDNLRAYLTKKEDDHKLRFEEAKKDGQLLTCSCCFDEENLYEDMIDCGRGHLFCKDCVRRGAEVAVGQGQVGLECMTENCNVTFSLQSLQMVLKASVFSNLLRKIQEDEISKADIPDLVQCPCCSFAAIMPNPEDKVFRCLNPECFKETCRFCREPNHVPLHCSEIEQSEEVKMRTYIENKMTDALLRECYKCKRRFMKVEGCNKMTCVCGAHMCYVCRQPIRDYSHFLNGRCPQMCNTKEMHLKEVITGAEKAKQEYIEQHPELKDTKLKHDPTQGLPPGEHSTANTTNNFTFAGNPGGMVGNARPLNQPCTFAFGVQGLPAAVRFPNVPVVVPPQVPPRPTAADQLTVPVIAPQPHGDPYFRKKWKVARRQPYPPLPARVTAQRNVLKTATAAPSQSGTEPTNVGQANMPFAASTVSMPPNPNGTHNVGATHVPATIANGNDLQKRHTVPASTIQSSVHTIGGGTANITIPNIISTNNEIFLMANGKMYRVSLPQADTVHQSAVKPANPLPTAAIPVVTAVPCTSVVSNATNTQIHRAPPNTGIQPMKSILPQGSAATASVTSRPILRPAKFVLVPVGQASTESLAASRMLECTQVSSRPSDNAVTTSIQDLNLNN